MNTLSLNLLGAFFIYTCLSGKKISLLIVGDVPAGRALNSASHTFISPIKDKKIIMSVAGSGGPHPRLQSEELSCDPSQKWQIVS